MTVLKKIYNVLDKICEPISCACLAGVIIITFVNVILRYCFSSPLGFIEEISVLLYTFLVFFELSVTHKRNSAVSVDIVVALMPEKFRRVMDTVSTILTLAVWVVLVYLGVKLAYGITTTYTSYLRIPYHYIYWFFPLSGFFCIIQLIRRLVLIFTGQEYVEKLEDLDSGQDQ